MDNAPKDAEGNKPEGADSPWGFLRGCLEWAGYCADPENFMSTLPVAFDGSCSGLQHFSAMFKDEVGGREVNLLPDLDRQDIYSAVKEAVEGVLQASDDPLATQWLKSGLMGRSLFKTPTMTYGYSSEVPGMTDQIKAYVKDSGNDAFAKDELFVACNYLAKITFSEIENIVVKAAEAKTWLQSCVKGKQEATQWTTPDGMVVVQKYKVRKSKQLNIMVEGERIRSRYDVPTDAVDSRKMASAIAPNVIHSLDAAHIRMVALAASGEQMHSLAMIHDSFGCHAADAGRFFNIIREQFVALYSGDVAEMLNAELSGGSVELPTMGTLDLEGIIDTDYSFA
jgi:DNA-directed RNA polymerase